MEKNLGYVNVPAEFSRLGTSLEVDTPAGMREATVVKKPFVDPTKEIPKS
jgi:aminomethyltransferase